jgi:hypothetical protein
MAITLAKITPTQHLSSIAWIMDAFPRQSDEALTLTPMQAYKVIQRRYSDGWSGFIRDLGNDTWV